MDGLLFIEQSMFWFIINGYSSWLYRNGVIKLLVDGVISMFFQWLLKQFMLSIYNINIYNNETTPSLLSCYTALPIFQYIYNIYIYTHIYIIYITIYLYMYISI